MAFNWQTRMVAAARCGGICANPTCNHYLFGPAEDQENYVAVVQGAHIVSESIDGPRHRSMPRAAYDSLGNCIPLCSRCHHVVDHPRNWHAYPETMLRRWRDDAEEMAYLRRGTPINVPYFDPAKARQVRDDFAQKLGSILNLMWHSFDDWRTLHRDAISQVHFGGRGFWIGGWHSESPLRSEDARVAYQQDRVVRVMSELSTILRKRSWYTPIFQRISGHQQFRPMAYDQFSFWQRQQDDQYEQELAAKIREFRSLAYEFQKIR